MAWLHISNVDAEGVFNNIDQSRDDHRQHPGFQGRQRLQLRPHVQVARHRKGGVRRPGLVRQLPVKQHAVALQSLSALSAPNHNNDNNGGVYRQIGSAGFLSPPNASLGSAGVQLHELPAVVMTAASLLPRKPLNSRACMQNTEAGWMEKSLPRL